MIGLISIVTALFIGLIAISSWGGRDIEVQAISVVTESQTVAEFTWSEFHIDAYEEYADEFTALFNSYETKWSKNGRLMIRQGDSGSFKFVAKG